MPVILVIWEVEMQRVMFWSQPRQKPCEIPYKPIAGCDGTRLEVEIRKIAVPCQPRQKKLWNPISMEKTGHVVHTCHPSNGGKCKIGGLWSKPACTKIKTLQNNQSSQALVAHTCNISYLGGWDLGCVGDSGLRSTQAQSL
jgi:hypothetical protein